MPVHAKRLAMPLSHALPSYLAANPYYDSLLARLSDYLARRGETLVCIDVGANIGDTIAAMYRPDARFLAIEPSQKYSSYLRNNWGQANNVTVINEVCSSVSATKGLRLVERKGTASLAFSDELPAVTAHTLDDISESYPAFARPRLVKVDTDGHDFEVLAGAEKLIERARPIVLFECDAFGNTGYVKDCLATLAFFESVGYRSFLLYDNLGYLMGRHTLADLTHFKDLLFYQLTSNFRYFDIIIMEESDIEPFHSQERTTFASAQEGKRLSQAVALLQN
jgi:FkbM family methyltransferase